MNESLQRGDVVMTKGHGTNGEGHSHLCPTYHQSIDDLPIINQLMTFLSLIDLCPTYHQSIYVLPIINRSMSYRIITTSSLNRHIIVICCHHQLPAS